MQSRLKNIVRRSPLWSFFILAYALQISVTSLHNYLFELPFLALVVLHSFSPTISALLVSAILGGYPEVRKMLAGFLRWKVGWQWYLAAFTLTGIPLLIALGYILLGNPVRGLRPGTTPLILLGALALNLVNGPLGEEAGWRGFALPRLQGKYNALVSSLILGLLWAGWHIPYYFELRSGGNTGIPFPIFVPILIGLSIVITWIYNNTGGSLVLSVLAHFAFNFSGVFLTGYFGLMPPMVLYTVGSALLSAFMVGVILIFKPKHLSKKPIAELPIDLPAEVNRIKSDVSTSLSV